MSTRPHPVKGCCSACKGTAFMAPSGLWWHDGPACSVRSQWLFPVVNWYPDGSIGPLPDSEKPARFIDEAS